jgi:Predicted nucleic acid-binding protein, contains PIN domain
VNRIAAPAGPELPLPESCASTLVLDTNVVLDLLVFDDVRTLSLKSGLLQGRLHWLATPPMREELARVLDYGHIAARLALGSRRAGDVLESFDRHARMVGVPVRAPVICSDPDDQMFIDLAVHHRCMLLSKDAAVLTLKKRLAAMQVNACAAFPAPS